MTRVFDCCMAFAELDMLELRMNVLNDVVDHFVIIEAGVTHSGQPKPQTVGDALATDPRFAPFADKIIYAYHETLDGDHSWTRERDHRARISDALRYFAAPEDWVIVGDADEIANPDAVLTLRDTPLNAVIFEQQLYYYDFNHRVQLGWGIGACRWKIEQDANKIRSGKVDVAPQSFIDGGWHLSYFATPEQVSAKLDAFMHHADVAANVPRDPAWLGAKMRAGEDIFGRNLKIERVPLSDNLPRYVLDNREKYATLGWLEREAVTT